MMQNVTHSPLIITNRTVKTHVLPTWGDGDTARGGGIVPGKNYAPILIFTGKIVVIAYIDRRFGEISKVFWLRFEYVLLK